MRFVSSGLWAAAAVASIAVFATSEARAQAGASTLTGRVVDASTKAPVADAVVTITSPELQGEETAITDANGYYRVGNLHPGVYTVRLDKEDFRPFSRDAINLRADVTLRLDSELLPEALKGEEIVVVASNPTVDVGSSNTGLNVSNEFARRVPIVAPGSSTGGAVRSYEAVAEATPGTKTDAYGTSVNGTTSPENNFSIDGLSRNNAGFGTNGARLSMEFVKEVNVLTAGYMPEYGTAGGGILSATTKTGSNEFHGSAWLFVSPGGVEGERARIRRVGQTITTQPTLKGIGDIGAEVGGPILKDKLWFYTGFLYARTSYDLNREITNQSTGVVNDLSHTYTAQRDDYQIFGKLTYAVDSRNRLTASAYVLPSYSGGYNRFAIDPQLGVPSVPTGTLGNNIAGTVDALSNRVVTNTVSTQLDWDSETPSKKVLFHTTVGYMHQLEDTQANDGTVAGDRFGLAADSQAAYRRNNPSLHGLGDFEPVAPWQCGATAAAASIQCPVTAYRLGGAGFLSTRVLDRWQARSIVTYYGELAGHHVVKGGVDLDFSQYASTVAYGGKDTIRESTNGNSFGDFRNFGYLTSPDERNLLDALHWKTHSLFLGGFIQDSWSIMDKVTLNAGVRYDAQVLWGGDNSVFMTLPNQIAPRVGAVWDPTQKGKSKIYGNFSRFYQPVPLDVVNRGGSSEPQASASRPASKCNPADPAQRNGSCQDPANFSTIGGPESPNQKYSLTGAGKTPVDNDIKPAYSDEIVFGAEYDLFKNARVGVNYTRRWLGRIIEDVSRDEATTYFITNPGERSTSDFPEPQRNYDAGTIFFQKTFGNNWDALVSYTLSYLRGNWAGLFRPETGQIDPFANADFDLKSLTVNRKGPLPGDSRHAIKVFTSRTFDITQRDAVTFGGAARAISGGPTSYLGSHPLYGANEVFILERGQGNRLPWSYSIDTSIAYTAKLPGDRTVSLSIDVFNLFNFQAITGRDQQYTASDVNPIAGGKQGDLSRLRTVQNALLQQREVNPNFAQPTSYQIPRQFRFGLRASF